MTLSSGVTIKAGQPVAGELITANTDPAIWGPDSRSFDPLSSVPKRRSSLRAWLRRRHAAMRWIEDRAGTEGHR